MPYDRTPGVFSLSPTQLFRGFTMGYLPKKGREEVTQGQPYVARTEEPQCAWEQDMNSALPGVLRAPGVSSRQVHLQLEAINTNFLLLFLHTRRAHWCKTYTQVRK